MIELVGVPQTLAQVPELLDCGIDVFIIGEERYGNRLPISFSRAEQTQITAWVHEAGKKVAIALNGIMHPDKMATLPSYLAFLRDLEVDEVLVGDTGVIHLLRQEGQEIPYWYDAHTLVTSAHQINFFAQRGAVGAVLARELPQKEVAQLVPSVQVPVEVLLYGPSCIHQSKRKLVQNYFRYEGLNESSSKERGWFLSEPQKAETHYSIYEDNHGTHIFADQDVLLAEAWPELMKMGVQRFKLESILLPEAAYLEACRLFGKAREALQGAVSDQDKRTIVQQLEQKIMANHPGNRGLGRGFYDLEPEDVK